MIWYHIWYQKLWTIKLNHIWYHSRPGPGAGDPGRRRPGPGLEQLAGTRTFKFTSVPVTECPNRLRVIRVITWLIWCMYPSCFHCCHCCSCDSASDPLAVQQQHWFTVTQLHRRRSSWPLAAARAAAAALLQALVRRASPAWSQAAQVDTKTLTWQGWHVTWRHYKLCHS